MTGQHTRPARAHVDEYISRETRKSHREHLEARASPPIGPPSAIDGKKKRVSHIYKYYFGLSCMRVGVCVCTHLHLCILVSVYLCMRMCVATSYINTDRTRGEYSNRTLPFFSLLSLPPPPLSLSIMLSRATSHTLPPYSHPFSLDE